MSIRSWVTWPGAPLAIALAALFGEGVNPWLLAGLLYLGSGIGLAMVAIEWRLMAKPSSKAPLALRRFLAFVRSRYSLSFGTD
ncbi:hypothetical protein DFR49_3227 [Hephaestia caeni]|jgi:hypothetical protein|uniref:Uncharacterized protein n=1 Tax=Hephaestia caeni TaxID=645617 RepID=A0A397NUF8_9SPHN|nr:hypothetical protein [Hephaestia caeni]RIA37344.1 hypothetical protein DFR49_3227 [Hephaestia caeni]